MTREIKVSQHHWLEIDAQSSHSKSSVRVIQESCLLWKLQTIIIVTENIQSTKKKKIKNKKVAGGSMEGMEGLNVFKRRIHKILQPQYKSINVGQWEVKGWI